MKVKQLFEADPRPPMEITLMESFKKKGEPVYLQLGKLRYFYQGHKYKPAPGVGFVPEHWEATFKPDGSTRVLQAITRQFYHDARFNVMYAHRIEWRFNRKETENGVQWELYYETV